MKLKRTGLVASTVMAALLTLAACGDDPEGGNGNGSGGTGGNDAAAECAEGSVELNGSGSSAQATAVEALIAEYSALCPETVINYEASGSGAGRQDFADGLNDFAGSDSAIDEEEERPGMDERCGEGNRATQFPLVLAPIAVVYHLEGVDSLTLDAATLAGIFSGQITTWNDPSIAALNEGVELPSTNIQTIHRSTDSGTTDNFTSYLDAASGGVWTFGAGDAWTAPGGEGAPDSAGVVSAVNGTDGAIGYVDGADAAKNDLATAALDSGFGPVELSPESVGIAVSAAERGGEEGDIVLDINHGLKEEGAYPAVLATYTMVCQSGNDAEKLDALKSFLNYWVTDGQQVLDDNGYSSLPDELRTDVEAQIETIS